MAKRSPIPTSGVSHCRAREAARLKSGSRRLATLVTSLAEQTTKAARVFTDNSGRRWRLSVRAACKTWYSLQKTECRIHNLYCLWITLKFAFRLHTDLTNLHLKQHDMYIDTYIYSKISFLKKYVEHTPQNQPSQPLNQLHLYAQDNNNEELFFF